MPLLCEGILERDCHYYLTACPARDSRVSTTFQFPYECHTNYNGLVERSIPTYALVLQFKEQGTNFTVPTMCCCCCVSLDTRPPGCLCTYKAPLVISSFKFENFKKF